MLRHLSLWQRLSLLFGTLLIACFGSAASLQMIQSVRYSQQIEQQLLHRLADHIAANAHTMGVQGLDQQKLSAFVGRLQVTNPGVELYVLDHEGRVEMRYPDSAALRRPQVDLSPVRDFLKNKQALVLGDDPLSASGSKAFSAASYARGGGDTGYLYAVLQGSAYDMAAAATAWDNAVGVALWSVGVIAPFGLLAGLAAFRWVTRPLTLLTLHVEEMELKQRPREPYSASESSQGETVVRDEIEILRQAFERLVATNAAQWQRLSKQDQQRRELIASLSHDLRSPLASLHGYLEALLMQSAYLGLDDRDRYLRSALAQSRSLSSLASELLDLAQMELGMVKPVFEHFSLRELVQDITQKLELSASSKNQRITTFSDANLSDVCADVGMIERVLTNLLDNAIRHSPADGDIRISLQNSGERVSVEISDSGVGVDPAQRPSLFLWPSERRPFRSEKHGHGLGLAIVQQILQLHGGVVSLRDQVDRGAVFVFTLARHFNQDVNGKGSVIGVGAERA